MSTQAPNSKPGVSGAATGGGPGDRSPLAAAGTDPATRRLYETAQAYGVNVDRVTSDESNPTQANKAPSTSGGVS